MQLNKYSKRVTQDPTQPAAQAMLYGVGLTDADMKKPQIGIASTGYDGNPCNMHLNNLANQIKKTVFVYATPLIARTRAPLSTWSPPETSRQ